MIPAACFAAFTALIIAFAAAFAALYDVLKRGKLIYKESNHKGRGYDTVTFAAPVKINDVVGNMAVVVRRTKGAHYDMHRIVMPDGSAFEFSAKKETAAGPTGGVPQSGSFYQSTETVSNDSISQPNAKSNTTDKNSSDRRSSRA